MAKSVSSLSTLELIAEINRRRQQQLPRLKEQAAKIEKQLSAINAQIAELSGIAPAAPQTRGKAKKKAAAKSKAAPAKGGDKRPHNKISLADAILAVLTKDNPMNARQIIAAVKKNGYKTKSDNFETIVYQTLAREKKRIAKASRGHYVLKG
ncbi:MAG: hypothetical protein M5U15_04455 [Kiritimatiellae bacterium]|nr:hypothetical protein [Kiritimatiellia bacterium]